LGGLRPERRWLHAYLQSVRLLGYPTEYQRNRIFVALNEEQLGYRQRSAEIARQRGFTYEFLDLKQLKELVPIVSDQAIGALYTHYGGHANPQRTVQAYAWALQDHGGRIYQHTTVTGIKLAGGRVTAVETTRGEFGADFLVIAAGPQTGKLAAMVGAYLPLALARAEIVVTEPMPLMYRGGVDGNGLYGRQTLRGNLVYGGGPHEWVDDDAFMATSERPTTPLIRNLARRLAELFPGAAHLRMIRSWAGIVENTPDGRPVVDRLETPNNVVVATMSSVGFGLSPAVGKGIMELVLHGKCLFADLSALRLSRFANTPPDWRERLGWVPAPPPVDEFPPVPAGV
jgi:sarcosine oxidase subunit beta